MKATDGSDAAKRRAGEHAADRITDGLVVGLGTGSTAAHAIRALGREVDAGLDVQGIPTSYQSAQLARDVGIPLTTLSAASPDVAIDGADQVAAGDLLKGGGGAHAREKVVDTAAAEFLVVVDDSKLAESLSRPVAIEVLPAARAVVADRVAALGGEAELRAATRKDGPVVTDNGNLVLDCEFGVIDEPANLAASLSTVPGAVEHGLFVGVADEVHVGSDEGVEVRRV